MLTADSTTGLIQSMSVSAHVQLCMCGGEDSSWQFQHKYQFM